MAPRDIIAIPDKRLRLDSEPVGKIDDSVRKLVEEMFEAMYAAPGIGLAAIQLGEAKRVVTIDLAKKDEEKEPQVFINPEIVWTSEEKHVHEEGCLSIPEYYEEVERPAEVKVKYTDLEGKAHEVRCQRHPRDLPAARDRSSQRRAVHRPPLEAEARPRRQEIFQAGQARGGGKCRSVSSSWARRISRCRRWSSSPARVTRLSRSIRARRSRPAAAWICRTRRSRARRSASGCRC